MLYAFEVGDCLSAFQNIEKEQLYHNSIEENLLALYPQILKYVVLRLEFYKTVEEKKC